MWQGIIQLQFSGQSSLSIFAQKYFCKCEETYFILQNKYLCIYKDSLGAKILRDNCGLSITINSGITIASFLDPNY